VKALRKGVDELADASRAAGRLFKLVMFLLNVLSPLVSQSVSSDEPSSPKR
jgi:hypothetical protein